MKVHQEIEYLTISIRYLVVREIWRRINRQMKNKISFVLWKVQFGHMTCINCVLFCLELERPKL